MCTPHATPFSALWDSISCEAAFANAFSVPRAADLLETFDVAGGVAKNGVQCVQPACLADVVATLHGQVPMKSELCGMFCLQRHRTLIDIDCGLASKTAEKAAAPPLPNSRRASRSYLHHCHRQWPRHLRLVARWIRVVMPGARPESASSCKCWASAHRMFGPRVLGPAHPTGEGASLGRH